MRDEADDRRTDGIVRAHFDAELKSPPFEGGLPGSLYNGMPQSNIVLLGPKFHVCIGRFFYSLELLVQLMSLFESRARMEREFSRLRKDEPRKAYLAKPF